MAPKIFSFFLVALLFGFGLFSKAGARHRGCDSSASIAGRRSQPQYGPIRGSDLELGEPEEIVQTEGGTIRAWRPSRSSNEDIRQRINVDMHEAELVENGLLIPKYMDAPAVAYVMEGCGVVGISSPFRGEFRQKYYLRRVKPGDIVAIPQGVTFWMYNDGQERQRVMCVSETSRATSPGKSAKAFHLSGAKGKGMGAVWHGFSADTVAKALGVDKELARELLTSQKDVAITKTRRKIKFPFPERTESDNAVPTEFTSTMHSGKADLIVKNGGWLSMVTSGKLPILSMLGMSALRVNLEPEAMVAPFWSPNAHQVLQILRGTGRLEVASHDGEELLQKDLRESDVIVIPKFFPSTILAGEDGVDFIKILTCDRPITSYLAGANSVYKGIPAEVVAEAFDIDIDMEMDIRRRRTKEEVILPPPSGKHEPEGDEDERGSTMMDKAATLLKDEEHVVEDLLMWAEEEVDASKERLSSILH